jgi:ABC-type amino acid transport substrate-binding protein
VPNLPYYVEKLRARLPQAHLRTADTIEALFDRVSGTDAASAADALALPAERGSAWTLRYPQYSAVVPLPDPIKIPLAFALPRGEPDLAALVNTWIDLKRQDGTIDELFRAWILGRSVTPPRPRWSIMRDVLRWEK